MEVAELELLFFLDFIIYCYNLLFTQRKTICSGHVFFSLVLLCYHVYKKETGVDLAISHPKRKETYNLERKKYCVHKDRYGWLKNIVFIKKETRNIVSTKKETRYIVLS